MWWSLPARGTKPSSTSRKETSPSTTPPWSGSYWRRSRPEGGSAGFAEADAERGGTPAQERGGPCQGSREDGRGWRRNLRRYRPADQRHLLRHQADKHRPLERLRRRASRKGRRLRRDDKGSDQSH